MDFTNLELEESLNEIAAKMPPFLEPAHLVALGLARTAGVLKAQRKRGEGPPFILYGKSIRYPRDLLLAYIRDGWKGGRL